ILSALVPPDALENCVLRDVRRIRLHLKSEVDTVIRAELAKRADHLECRGLLSQARRALRNDVVLAHDGWVSQAIELKSHHRECLRRIQLVRAVVSAHLAIARSEEHTSELQSRENLVCRLLLEKKKHSLA